MRLSELFRIVWLNIVQNKFKVLLTSVGIIIGAATIVMVIAVGKGGQQEVANQFKNLNAGSIDISYTSSSGNKGSSDTSSGSSNSGSSMGGGSGNMPSMGNMPNMGDSSQGAPSNSGNKNSSSSSNSNSSGQMSHPDMSVGNSSGGQSPFGAGGFMIGGGSSNIDSMLNKE